MDAFYDTKLKSGSVLVSNNPTSNTGILVPGYGLVLGFLGTPMRQASPILEAHGVTTIGMKTTLRLSQGLENSAAGLIFGFSNTTFGALSLPLDLGGLGAKGCQALASIEHVHPMPVDKDGAASLDLHFPPNPSMIGASST